MIEVLRSVLAVPNVYVGSARRETAIPGATSSSEADIWDTETIGLYILAAPMPSLRRAVESRPCPSLRSICSTRASGWSV